MVLSSLGRSQLVGQDWAVPMDILSQLARRNMPSRILGRLLPKLLDLDNIGWLSIRPRLPPPDRKSVV